MGKKEVEKIKNNFLKKSSFLILSHAKPDGDSVGSSVALALLLKNLDKRVFLVFNDEIPKGLSFIYNFVEISHTPPPISDIEAVAILDCVPALTGFNKSHPWFFENLEPVVELDHHEKDYSKNHIHYHSTESSSTCELVWELSNSMGWKITKNIAESLLVGIYTDTNGFVNENVTPKTLLATADLIEKGASSENVMKFLKSKTEKLLKAIAIVIERLKISKKSKIASTYLTNQDIEKMQATRDDLAGISNFLSQLSDVNVTLFISEFEKGIIKGSLRSRGEEDVSRIARIFSPSGGGHKKAAGFSLPGTFVPSENGGWKLASIN